MSSVDLGAAIYIAIKPILKIYSIIFVGFLLAKYNIVTTEIARGISNMVVNAILPCLTFNKIVSNLSWHDIKEIGVIVLSALVLFALGTFLAVVTNYVARTPKDWFWGLIFAGLFPNISDLPIAYVQSMGNGAIFTQDESDKGVAYSCIFLTVQSFLMMNFGLWRLVGKDFKAVDDCVESGSGTNEVVSPQDTNKQAKAEHYVEKTNEILSQADQDNNVRISNKEKDHLTLSDVVDSPERNFRSGTSTSLGSIQSIDSLYSSENSLGSDNDNDNENTSKVETIKQLIPEEAHKRITNKSSAMGTYKTFSAPAEPYSTIEEPSRIDDATFQDRSAMKKLDISRTHSSGCSFSGLRRRRTVGSKNARYSMNELIAEYSTVDRVKTGELDLTKPLTLIEEVGTSNVNIGGHQKTYDIESANLGNELSRIDSFDEIRNNSYGIMSDVNSAYSASDNHSIHKISFRMKLNKFMRKHKLEWLGYIAINFCRPASLGALLGIICALVPYLKALFVVTYVHVHLAPDGEPVLNFLMDFTAYIGNACIPLGLLMLGGTLARLEIKTLPKGFLKTAVMLTALKLAFTPVIGVLWTNKLYELNWLENRIGRFVMILTFSMPSATAQVYFTAFYTPVGPKHVQMDCLSVFFLLQYCVLFISLSIVLTYTLKVNLGV